VGIACVAETPNATGIKAQQEAKAKLTRAAALKSENPAPIAECAFTFISGSGFASMQYCVTANGNIVQFAIPSDVPLISTGDLGEGYGICDATSGTEYSDYGGFGDSGNWRAAKVLKHDATSVKIARTTSDGNWTLTQTITQATAPPSAKIVMTLRNNTTATRAAALLRFADVDADGSPWNTLDATDNSALGWISAGSAETGQPFGLELQNLNTVLDDSSFAFVQNIAKPPAPCNPTANFNPGVLNATDGSLVMLYRQMYGPQTAVTNTVTYKGW
jgi:hypothetical protein